MTTQPFLRSLVGQDRSVLSFCLSGRFLGICSLDLLLAFAHSECWYGFRDLCEVLDGRAGFSNKIFSGTKIRKMLQIYGF